MNTSAIFKFEQNEVRTLEVDIMQKNTLSESPLLKKNITLKE